MGPNVGKVITYDNNDNNNNNDNHSDSDNDDGDDNDDNDDDDDDDEKEEEEDNNSLHLHVNIDNTTLKPLANVTLTKNRVSLKQRPLKNEDLRPQKLLNKDPLIFQESFTHN